MRIRGGEEGGAANTLTARKGRIGGETAVQRWGGGQGRMLDLRETRTLGPEDRKKVFDDADGVERPKSQSNLSSRE